MWHTNPSYEPTNCATTARITHAQATAATGNWLSDFRNKVSRVVLPDSSDRVSEVACCPAQFWEMPQFCYHMEFAEWSSTNGVTGHNPKNGTGHREPSMTIGEKLWPLARGFAPGWRIQSGGRRTTDDQWYCVWLRDKLCSGERHLQKWSPCSGAPESFRSAPFLEHPGRVLRKMDTPDSWEPRTESPFSGVPIFWSIQPGHSGKWTLRIPGNPGVPFFRECPLRLSSGSAWTPPNSSFKSQARQKFRKINKNSVAGGDRTPDPMIKCTNLNKTHSLNQC